MKISKRARRTAKQLFRKCVADGSLDEQKVRRVVREVLERKPREYFPILAHFKRLVKLDMERRRARVESAIALSDEMRENVKNNLTRLYGNGLNLSFAENPELIGGMSIRVGSDVYDGSLRGRLLALKERF